MAAPQPTPNAEPGRAYPVAGAASVALPPPTAPATLTSEMLFRIQLAGPGINTQLDVTDAADLALVRALLDKIERQLNR
ncbi:MAG: hypothetical protein WKG07_30400 [Hymenobacter sp.]